MASSFPSSGDEDVEIRLPSEPDDTFLLHSYVLALHSRWFKASLSERWQGTKSANDGQRWIYELRFDKDNAFGLLGRRATATETESVNTEFITRQFPTDASSAVKKLHKQRLPRVDAHKRMLEAMYHITPTFENSFHDAKTSMLQLTEVAEAYECQQVVKIHVINHLNFTRTEVLDSCASDPIDLLELATAVKAEWLFTEASIGVIGLWKGAFAKCEPRLRALGCWDLFQEKRIKFHEKLVNCEMQLFEMQPVVYRTKNATLDGSSTNANMNGSSQLAIDFFRQWLSEKLKSKDGSRMRAGYAVLYRDIARRQHRGDTDPSEVEDVEHFLKRCQSTVERPQVHKEVAKVFATAAKIIAPILENKSKHQNDDGLFGQNLTFIGINESEIP